MHKRKIILINIIFVALTIVFLFLSLILNFVYFIPFFFLPIICWLPFAFRGRKQSLSDNESYVLPKQSIRYCPVCRGEIREPIAKFCYHCGAKLNNDLMR